MRYSIDIISIIVLLVIFLIRSFLFVYFPDPSLYFTLPLFLIFTMVAVSIKHNHIHVPVFKNKILNIIYDHLLNILTGTSTSSVKIIHIVNHHFYNDNEQDWGKTSQAGKASLFASFIRYILITPFAFFKGKTAWVRQHKNHPLISYMRWESLFIIVIYTVLAFIDPVACLFTVIIPFIMTQLVLTAFNFLQHFECDTENEMNSSRNITGRLFNILYFNVGFHTVHHLYPKLHWSKIPDQFSTIKKDINSDLIHRGFWSTMKYVVFHKTALS